MVIRGPFGDAGEHRVSASLEWQQSEKEKCPPVVSIYGCSIRHMRSGQFGVISHGCNARFSWSPSRARNSSCADITLGSAFYFDRCTLEPLEGQQITTDGHA